MTTNESLKFMLLLALLYPAIASNEKEDSESLETVVSGIMAAEFGIKPINHEDNNNADKFRDTEKNVIMENINSKEDPDSNLDPVRLETIDVDGTVDKNSALKDNPKSDSNVSVSVELSGDGNSTLNGTSPQNNTSKSIPKRVKCLSLMQEMKSNENESTDTSVDESETNENNSEATVGINSNNGVAEVMNGTTFLKLMSDRHNPNITNRSTPGECTLVIFYASWCPFSAMAAPSFNGLARIYPDVKLYAVDSSKYQSINTQFGILALPTLILFHNTKPISKFNHSNYMLENFSEFVNTFTGLEPLLPLELQDQDMEGPMPTKAVPEPDFYLYLAWIFTIVCALGYFGKSSYCEWIIESVRNNWREAEIQHEHID